MKVSFVLFDEIEKASDALWNLLLGILDKATLTLGDNRKVDFSKAMIFMTSNLGAAEMTSIMAPKLGFGSSDARISASTGVFDEKMTGKIARSGVEAARRKFTPEFMNRLDKIVTFSPLGTEQLKKILDIELNLVQQRIFNTSNDRAFVFTMSDHGKDFLLAEGTDLGELEAALLAAMSASATVTVSVATIGGPGVMVVNGGLLAFAVLAPAGP